MRTTRKPYNGTHGDREMMIIGVGQRGSEGEKELDAFQVFQSHNRFKGKVVSIRSVIISF